ncbi:tetratricopeptide repeat protein [Pedomonas mirosovicensis]|uniref:tetratricopeptide repeat protein n=1 Tax=Pedomonas mirosovicensis TaxID=2908641 RepID=UPI0021679A14|nr:tetratricopeptide repeat protein [Pedomonas mirosovicensis]MCH8685640.1 tetratricopeptide repeat protein [Pedomonas mirosovicensis]
MRQSDKLASQAADAFNGGDPAKAVALFQNVLRLDPKHRGALNFLSHYTLQSGQFDAAINLLTDLIKLEPGDSNARRMLGEALEMKGQPDAAEKLYRDALVADPANYMAAIYLAILLARHNRMDQAMQIVSLTFQAAPGFIEYGYRPEVFPAASRRVRDADQLLRGYLSAQHRDSAKGSERIMNAVWPQAATKPVEYKQEGQRPWLFYVPDLKAELLHDASGIPGVAGLKDAAEAIIAEATRTFDLEADGEPGAPGLPPQIASSEIRSIFLYRNGERQDALDSLPAAEKALSALPLGRVGDGPADARLVILAAGAERPLVSGQSNAHLTVHLPLVVSEGEAGIEVDGTLHPWVAGTPLVFDDTFEHRLVNRTEAPCLVLTTQVYHPDLSAEDIAAIEASFEARRQWLAKRSFG